jgi:hydrophobic/amphiphilic exporter-1 (mainly G- bacteria), HAE1 family
VFTEFFIKRPVFATVISIIMILAGAIAIPSLPISQYPAVAPPQIQVASTYIGASAEQVEASVTSTLEREVNGIEGLKYISSASGNDGSSKITATFNMERGSDQAALDVQTKVSSAQGRLPEEVKRLGVSVDKVSTSVVMALALYSADGKYSQEYLSNYADIYLKDVFKSINGVGSVSLVGERKYAMRIWLNPNKLSQVKMTPLDVVSALQSQNRQVGAGDLGASPAPSGQKYQYNLNVTGRMRDPKEFGRTVVKRGEKGALIHLEDVATVELGAENYQTDCSYQNRGAVAMVVYLRSGGNALKVSQGIRKELSRLEKSFPPGMKCAIALDTTEAVEESIQEVVKTLYEAIFLVVLVIFFFLQDWRSMLIACVTIPVSLIGTFVFMKLAGFSINTLTLFGLTLATGLVVDDAIVVVENVKRHLEEAKITALDATILAMRETAGALIATALVLVAVFIPVAFFPGTTGQLYKQFALTIAVSVALSAFNALTLSPALSAILLKAESEHQPLLFRLINRLIDAVRSIYEFSLRLAVRFSPAVIIAMLASLAMVWWLYKVLPTGFVPDEDQGYYFILIRGPDGTSLQYTKDVVEKAVKIAGSQKEAEPALGLSGFGFSGVAPNFGLVFCPLKHWKHRKEKDSELKAVVERVGARLSQITDAAVLPFNPPALEGLGQVGGFTYELQDPMGRSTGELSAAAGQLIKGGNSSERLQGLFTNFTAGTPRLQINIKRDLAETLNVDVSQVLDTLQILLGSSYVNDFDYLNRNYRVYVQADKAFRTEPQSLFEYYVRSRDNKMVGIENLLDATPTLSAPLITHYNLFRSVEINGNPAPGYSSGQAIEAMEQLSGKLLAPGMKFSWSAMSLEEIEAGGSAVLIFALGLVFVFLVLSAQYESYTDPVIILFSVPPAVLGALSGQWLRGLENDVFCQIGLVMLVGLASKNAILIVEFANHLLKDEKLSFGEAAVKASSLRLRPILMTSLAFVVGLLPLVFAHGAGSHSRQSLGTAVCAGMVVSTIISLYLVPVIFVLVKSFLSLFKREKAMS